MVGTRPSGGSMTIEARAVFIGLSWSTQCCGGLMFADIATGAAGPPPAFSNGVASKFTHIPRRSG